MLKISNAAAPRGLEHAPKASPDRWGALRQPFRIGKLELANRLVMSPMTRRFSPGGVPTTDVAAYYRRRAEGGVGLILTEGTTIDRPGARNHARIPFFHGEEPLKGWAEVVSAVRTAGGSIGPQLWHVGSVPNQAQVWEDGPEAESPSGLFSTRQPRGRQMSEEDIADTIAAFARAAATAERLGFDTVELHGGHGYLIDQFFWEETNRRSDRYGGKTLAERARFAAELIRAVRAAVSPGFPIILRVSQWKLQDYTARLATSPTELGQWLGPLVEAGVDVLDCSQRRFWEPEFPDVDGKTGLNLAGWAKKLTGAVTIAVGSVGLPVDEATPDGAETAAVLDNLMARLERGEFDLVAVGRALLSDPDWCAKIFGLNPEAPLPHQAEHLGRLF